MKILKIWSILLLFGILMLTNQRATKSQVLFYHLLLNQLKKLDSEKIHIFSFNFG